MKFEKVETLIATLSEYSSPLLSKLNSIWIWPCTLNPLSTLCCGIFLIIQNNHIHISFVWIVDLSCKSIQRIYKYCGNYFFKLIQTYLNWRSMSFTSIIFYSRIAYERFYYTKLSFLKQSIYHFIRRKWTYIFAFYHKLMKQLP